MLDGRFTPDAFAAATSAMRAERRYTSLVPAQLRTLLDAAEDLPAVRTALAAYDAILIGGQWLEHHRRDHAEELGARIVSTYGSSETSGGCVYDGVPLDGMRVASIDGELRIAGPTLASGYLGDDDLTRRVFGPDSDGVHWYRTGDAGDVTDGVVEVRGRIDNVIVSGGINVSLDRVERIVRTVPGLEAAVVVAMPDERWGEASVIFAAVGAFDESAAFHEARERVAAEIGRHARPAQLETSPELPMLASGKPDRELLRRMILD
ncbi:AMP-binding enzyme [Microbacterium sp. KUDC0406]|uniref:AMP-binding enzyme n=1 Tax=Microbacterium sp. KUDC0406 TaxID=2909588 RepID=UPI002E34DA2C|nr:o-succinylbenzoate--CoA ligase [Microbacterium sp. KUDC0406]